MQHFKVIFYPRKTRALSNGQKPIYTRLSLNGSRIEIGSTGLSTDEDKWDASTARIKGRAPEISEANSNLDRLESDFLHIFHLFEHDENLSLELIKDYYNSSLAKPSAEKSFMNFFEEYLQDCKEKIGITHVPSVYTRYELTYRLFAEFLKRSRRRSDLTFNELNYGVVSDFDKFLMIEKGYHNNNTKMKKMRCFKTVILKARRLGKLAHDPFMDYKIHYDAVDRGFLTDEELKRMMQKKFKSPRLEAVRDFFVFSCFTGLAYSDVYRLTTENIVEMNGKLWLMINRQKTDVPTHIILLDIPKLLIEKYSGLAPDDRLLPLPSNQKVNSYLKEIADMCNINKNLTFHLARHTFATMSLSKGVPMETVSRMLGHNSLRTTMIYARVTNKKVEDDMSELSAKLDTFGSFLKDNGSKVKQTKRKFKEAEDSSLLEFEFLPKRGRPRKKKK